jgi:3-deoxy-7-phosphoheptulonate synthase
VEIEAKKQIEEPVLWTPDGWRRKTAQQQPRYVDEERLARAYTQLQSLPPLTTSWEIDNLKEQLARAQHGEAFVLQGGDCAESFSDCRSERIVSKIKILMQMGIVISASLRKPVTRIGRLAGQYAKPRSSDMEERDGTSLPSYRGDLVNRNGFTANERNPDPDLLLRGYERAALTLNFVRSLADGGFADLHHPDNWDLDFFGNSDFAEQGRRIVQKVADSLDIYESLIGAKLHEAKRVDLFASHEGLHLLYEQAQTRYLPHRDRWYNLTTHMPWIGMRTADPDCAHVDFFSGIANPIGVKVGNALSVEQLQTLVETLNPDNEPGRLSLIHRFGAGKIAEDLPKVIRAVQDTGINVVWICDPMHGNTESLPNDIKTRSVDNIVSELKAAFRIHEANNSHLGGVHLELTGERVTECVGGPHGLTAEDLTTDYRSQVDPRLNYDQAMEVAIQIAHHGEVAS